MTVRPIVLALVAGAFLLAACGESTTESDNAAAPPPATVTVTETVAAEPEPEPEPAPAPKKAKPKQAAASTPSRDCIKVPNVTGADHQGAQDTMQAAGLYLLDEEDATGQGRMLILDRNWTVVSQRPAAGTCVSDDTTILLRSRKDGE